MNLSNLFTSEGRHYEKAKKIQKQVLELEEEYSNLSDDELKNKTVIFKIVNIIYIFIRVTLF